MLVRIANRKDSDQALEAVWSGSKFSVRISEHLSYLSFLAMIKMDMAS